MYLNLCNELYCHCTIVIVIDYILCVIKIIIIIKAIKSVPTLVATIAEIELWANSATVVCKPQTPVQEPQLYNGNQPLAT